MFRTFPALGVVLAACTAAPTSPPDGVDEWLEGEMARRHLPGLVFAVARDGNVVDQRAYGYADLELRAPAMPQTVFEIGSLTKQFTAAATLQLVEEGRLDLGRTLGDEWPDAPEHWRKITLRHVLRHTSGLRNHVAVPGYLAMFKTDLFGVTEPGPKDVVHRFHDLPSEFEPGQSWAYDNTGYWLLGRILERVSGQDYFSLLERRLFAPAGLVATRSTAAAPLVPGRARGYEWTGQGYENRPALPPAVAFSAGSVLSTVGDLARWVAALTSGRVVSAASLDALWTPAPNRDGTTPPYDYGYGWFLGDVDGTPFVQHSGGTPGFSSVLYHFPTQRLTVVMLANVGDRMLDALALDLAARHEPALHPRRTADSDLARTAKVRDAVTELLEGRHDAARYSASMNLFLASRCGAGTWEWHASHGQLEQFEFWSERAVGDERVLRCHARLGDAWHWLTARVDAEGRIAQLHWF